MIDASMLKTNRDREERKMKVTKQFGDVSIMIIDDNPIVIDVLRDILSEIPVHHIALDGENALLQLSQLEHLPDIILLDMMLPGISGVEVCKRIKSYHAFSNIPIIFISALNETFDKIKAFEAGGADYITKPFQYLEVLARVQAHLNAHLLKKELDIHNKHLEKLVMIKSKEVFETQMATIDALVRLVESRDDETGKHLMRVRNVSKRLAEKLGSNPKYRDKINVEFVALIEKASVLHDIGKVGISDAILLKPGKLTVEEFEKVKKHTIIGAETLIDVDKQHPGNKFIETGIEITMYHHERWDGKGYPDGLGGENIPLSARIVAVSDTYDALRSKRTYKDRFNHTASCEIIMSECGTHFDPDIIEVFKEIEHEFEHLYIEE
jgi:putative two-component system response regulator